MIDQWLEIGWSVVCCHSVWLFMFLFKVSTFKTYEVASLKRANTEKSADILVGVLKETREVGRVYHEIIQKCTQLNCKWALTNRTNLFSIVQWAYPILSGGAVVTCHVLVYFWYIGSIKKEEWLSSFSDR